MDDKNKNKKHVTTEAQKKNETQKFSDSEKLSDSVVVREILKKRVEELENQVKRIFADYQNLEKRTEQEQRDWIVKANRQLIIRLLPILDTLILAREHVQDESLPLSIKQFLDILKSEGVERVEAVGQEFNPKTMQCVETVEGEEGKVMSEIRAGFLMQDEVLRAALVRVGKKGN